MLQFLKLMPKLELHAHLGGSIPRKTLKELLHSQGHHKEADRIDTVNLEVQGFFNSLFSGSALAMQTQDGLRKAVRAVLEAFIEDNVVYLELRTTPRSGTDYSVIEYFNIIVEEGSKYPAIELRIIVSLNRGVKSMEAYQNLIGNIQLVNNWKKNIVGIDFSGDPKSRTFKQFIPILLAAREIGLGITIHTAQVQSQIPETAEILSIKPDRIGHLNYFTQQQLKQIKQLGIVIEVCISSNVVVKQLASQLQHHVDEFVEYNMKHCLGSDDLLLFESTLSQEFEKYARIVKLEEKQCYKLSKETADYMFDKTIKAKVMQHFAIFEQQWKEKYAFFSEN